MTMIYRLIYLGLCIFLHSLCLKTENITVGYLVGNQHPDRKGLQGRIISGAISYAFDVINNDTTRLENHTLILMYNDTAGDVNNSTRALTYQWKDGAVAFIGPEDSCSVEATITTAWKLPMISFKCSNPEVSDKKRFPTFARTEPPDTQIVNSVILLLKHFNWTTFTIVTGNSVRWMIVQKTLKEKAEKEMTVSVREFPEPFILNDHLKNPFPKIVEDTYLKTRVYIFIGDINSMVEFLLELHKRGLLDTGEYVLIYLADEPNDAMEEPLKFFTQTSEKQSEIKSNPIYTAAARSLLVICPSSPIPTPENQNFSVKVNEYLTKPPFNHVHLYSVAMTKYAYYLYDAAMLYADALDEVLKENGRPTDGLQIINKIRNRNYTSIYGYKMRMDDNGDASGNFSLLARKSIVSNVTNYTMLQVGIFTEEKLLESETVKIEWVRGEPPKDEPDCGFDGEKCKPPKDLTVEVVGGTLGGLFAFAIIVGVIAYRNWKFEQEIAGILWKIDIKEISIGSRAMTNSRLSLASQMSIESRLVCGQIFTQTGRYKGTLVAIKRLEFSKKSLDISRQTKKEMKMMRDLRHDNINAFIGACVEPPVVYIITEYCSRGSLPDILENENLKLDTMFTASLVFDLIKGMTYLHQSEFKCHGNLKASNCLVTSRWTLQVSDFGLYELRSNLLCENESYQMYRNLLWKAPEFLKSVETFSRGSPKGDVYAFGIILYEILGRQGPYGLIPLTPEDIIHKIRNPVNGSYFRPNLDSFDYQNYLKDCMRDCWDERPEVRPDFSQIRSRLSKMREGMKPNIFDNMMAIMEKYANNLEDIVEQRTEQLVEEKKKTEALLYRMLPPAVASQLMRGQPVAPETFDAVSIYFSDIVGFTSMSAKSTPLEVVTFLNDLYTLFDAIIRHYEVYKVETIGDAYMVVSGLPNRNNDQHAGEIASMALHLLQEIKTFRIRHLESEQLMLRIGLHTGPCVAGVVGLTMPRYCLFGDTVNTASRMESTGEALRIHCSSATKTVLDKLGGYILEDRGFVKLKGKGDVNTYWLTGKDPSVDYSEFEKYLEPPTPFFSIANEDIKHLLPNLETRKSILSLKSGSISKVSEELKHNGLLGIPELLKCKPGVSSFDAFPGKFRRGSFRRGSAKTELFIEKYRCSQNVSDSPKTGDQIKVIVSTPKSKDFNGADDSAMPLLTPPSHNFREQAKKQLHENGKTKRWRSFDEITFCDSELGCAAARSSKNWIPIATNSLFDNSEEEPLNQDQTIGHLSKSEILHKTESRV